MAPAVLSLLAAATPLHAAPADADRQLQELLAGRVAGAPVGCINLALAGEAQVIDGRAIVYEVGQTLYVNEPQGADQLRRDDVLVTTTTFGTQLCRIEAVRLIDRAGQFQRGIVTLNSFVPYAKPSPDR